MPHRIPDCSTRMASNINTFLGGLEKKASRVQEVKCCCIPLDFPGPVSKTERPPPGAYGKLQGCS